MRDTVTPRSLHLGEYSLLGVSTAGVGTCITVPEWKFAFDVAQGLPFAVSMRNFLVSHMHQDHASGIPYLISQKAMHSHKPPTFFVPPTTAEKLHSIVQTWQDLEDHKYEYNLKELAPGEMQHLDKELYVQSFITKHRVISQGYTVFLRRKQLKRELKGLSEVQITELRRQGQSVEEFAFAPKISFTGDTQIEFLDLAPEVKNSETLIMEVTYVDEKKSVESARKWGHIHMDEVIARVPEIQSKNIIWIHLSARYSHKEVRKLIDQRLPEHKDRIHIL